MIDIDRPIPESYWVLPGQLLAGEYPGQSYEELTRRRIAALIEAGFHVFIDLTQSHETTPYTGILSKAASVYGVTVAHQRYPIGDFGLPTVEQMNSILDAIDEGVQAGHKIYLHCLGGIGRTGTTVGCYLVRRGKAGPDALAQLSSWWRDVPKSRYHPHSPETKEQSNFILNWAKYDRKFSKVE